MEIHTGTGKLTLAGELLTAVAGVAAMEVEGVLGTTPRKSRGGLAELLGKGNAGRGVLIEWDGKRLFAEVHLVVGYGEPLAEVAAAVERRVRRSLEEHTGSLVERVDVVIQSVRRESGKGRPGRDG